jgi:hypothetical protein
MLAQPSPQKTNFLSLKGNGMGNIIGIDDLLFLLYNLAKGKA